jgi:hypothetical protein
LEGFRCSAFVFLLHTRPENLDRASVVVIAASAKEIQWKKFPGLLKKEEKKMDVSPRILQLAMRVF